MSLIFKSIENNPALVTIGLFLLGGIGFLIKHFFFSEKKARSPYIKAGGDISAGGDIVVGDKVEIKTSQSSSKNLTTFEDLISNARWRKEIITQREIYICEKDNTFQIEIGECGGEFHEKWTQVYPDKGNVSRYPVYMKIGNTTIKEFTFISCDGGRIFVPIPELQSEGDQTVCIWRKDSLPYKICQIVGHYYIYKTIEGIAQVSKIKII